MYVAIVSRMLCAVELGGTLRDIVAAPEALVMSSDVAVHS
jgi:hypothetical protein